MLRGSYPEDGPFRNQMDHFLTLSVDTFESKPARIIPEALPFEYNRIIKALIPCSALKTDISDVNYSENDLKDAVCLEFDEKFEIGGSYTEGLLRSFVVNLRPCVRSAPASAECRPKRYNQDGTFTVLDLNSINQTNNFNLITEYLRDFSLEFGYIEETPGLDDFNKPIVRNLIFKNMLKINSGNLSQYKYYLAKTIVETESGWFRRETTEQSGLRIDNSNFKFLRRKPTDLRPLIYTTNGVAQRKNLVPEFYTIQFELTNQVYTVLRVYESFLDFLGNVGGVFEILLSVFMLVLTIHSSLGMELYFLNSFSIGDQAEDEQEFIEYNKVADITQAKKKKGFKKYSYGELFYFSYFGFLNKKCERYQQFLQHQDAYKKKLDIKKLILN